MSWVAKVRSDAYDFVGAIPAIAALTETDLIESQLPPVIERQDLTQREIAVFVDTAETTLASRHCRTRSFAVWITIVEPLKQGQEDTQIEANQLLVDAIEQAALGVRLGGDANGVVTGFEQTVVLSPKHWNEFRQYASYIKLTVEV